VIDITPPNSPVAAPAVAALMGRELGWDESRRKTETERYREQVDAIPRGGRYF